MNPDPTFNSSGKNLQEYNRVWSPQDIIKIITIIYN